MSATEKLYELPSSLGKESELSLLSLLGTLYIFYRRFSVLRTTIQYQVKSTYSILSEAACAALIKLTVRFFYPTYSLKVCRFLYYFCLCKSFKELFLSSRFLESGCKGTAFFRTTKTFRGKFSSFMQNLIHSWQISRDKIAYTLLIYNIRSQFMSLKTINAIGRIATAGQFTNEVKHNLISDFSAW